MTDPRLRTIRVWLLAAVVVAALLVFPAWKLLLLPWPLALFMPVFSSSSCTVVSDNFSTDLLATNYTVSSGSWTVSGGTLNTTSANALVTHNSTVSGSYGSVGATLTASASGITLKLIGAYTDDDNYLYARAVSSTSIGNQLTITLWDRTGGVDTQLNSANSVTLSGWTGSIFLCWDGTFATLTVNTTTGRLFDLSSKAGSKCGAGTTANAGTASFDNLSLLDRDEGPSCTTCLPCESHDEYTTPRQVQVDLSGTPTTGSCGNCASVPTTYIVDRTTNFCQYRKTGLTTCSLLSAQFDYLSTGPRFILQTGVGTEARWEASATAPYDGTDTYTGVPYVSGVTTRCDYSGLTADFTPIA